MIRRMFAKVPQPSVLLDAVESEPAQTRRIDWHALIARLQAERDLRCSLEGASEESVLATMLSDGSFDPRAAEMMISLAAGIGVAGDSPERRFAPEDLARIAAAEQGGELRLPNPKPSGLGNPEETAEPIARTGDAVPPVSDDATAGHGTCRGLE